MQEAFQQGAVKEFPGLDAIVLPEKDIDESLSKKGAVAYKAIVDGKMSGGAIVIIDESTQHNHLDFLYVRCGILKYKFHFFLSPIYLIVIITYR